VAPEPNSNEQDIPVLSDETVSDTENINMLKNALEEEKTKAEANLLGWQRAQADFVNYKRRIEQERSEISKFANAGLITDILPVLDNLERAFASVPDSITGDAWVDGIMLIERNLRSALESRGLAEIKAIGETFDPNIHEAAMHVDGEEDKVIQELQKGYKLHERVIRPSTVVVGNGKKNAEEEETKEE